MTSSRIYITLATLSCLLTMSLAQHKSDCSREEYNRCVSLADPLMKEPHMVFPDNMQDIELVCLTWNQFVDCLKRYLDRCFTAQQRKQFNKAVENSIESVHQMCTQRTYQQEYLQHASCIKSTITQHQHCGDQYIQMVQQVEQKDALSRANLCCLHDRFRKCVMREVKRLCDRGEHNGQAISFAGQIIDKALSFFQDQCYNYIPNSGDCNLQSRKTPEDQLTMSTASWPGGSTNSRTTSDLATLSTGVSPLEVSVSNPGSTDTKVTDISWLPSVQEETANTNWRKETVTREPSTFETQGTMLGTRTRPSSYGRSSSWETTNPSTRSNWATPTPQDAPSRPDWATVSTWHVQSKDPRTETTFRHTDYEMARHTTETWYPAAGSHVGNEVDEPNQLGLTKPKNSTCKNLYTLSLILIMLTTIFINNYS